MQPFGLCPRADAYLTSVFQCEVSTQCVIITLKLLPLCAAVIRATEQEQGKESGDLLEKFILKLLREKKET